MIDDVGRMTIDELVTWLKFRGSSITLLGFTTPERWPFRVVIAVESPGNDGVVSLVDELAEVLSEIAPPLLVEGEVPYGNSGGGTGGDPYP